jgi:hypothetical protein
LGKSYLDYKMMRSGKRPHPTSCEAARNNDIRPGAGV